MIGHAARGALRSAVVGALYGALLYGAAISLRHIAHNGTGSVLEALASLLFFALLYGGLAAIFFALAGAAVAAVEQMRAARIERWVGAASGRFDLPALSGLIAFSLVFWEGVALYGLTYQQTLLFRPRAWLGMYAYLAFVGLLVAAAVVAAALGFEALRGRLKKASRSGLALAGAASFALLAHLALPLLGGRGFPAGGTAGSQSDVVLAQSEVKVVLVGLDGADPVVLERYRDRLPEFERIRKSGVGAPLSTLSDANSAVIWASIYTGLAPQEHGVLDFYRVHLPGLASGLFPVHRTWFKELVERIEPFGLVRRQTIDRRSVRSPLLWEVLDHFGVPVGVVDGYLYSYPAYRPENAASYFLAYGLDSFARDLDQGLAEPLEVGRYVQPSDLLAADRLPRGDDFDWQAEALLQLLHEREQPAFVNFYTHQPDSIQHWSWKWLEPEKYPRVSAAEVAERGGDILEQYLRFDRFLAQLSGAVDGRTVIIVLSDHGHAATPVHSLYTQHRHGPPGILWMSGGPIVPTESVLDAHVYDIFPTVLYLLGLPIPEDGEGRVLQEAIDPDFLAKHPISTIPTYRGLWSPEVQEVEHDPRLDEREMEKLRALGYVGGRRPPDKPETDS